MAKYHEMLLNQLNHLNIEWDKEPESSHWLKLLAIISDTYSHHDKRRCPIKQSKNKAASEETCQANTRYETPLPQINMVSSDGILITDENWIVTSLNTRGELLLGAKEASFLHEKIDKKLVFLNSQKTPIDFHRLKCHFECGQHYSCSKGVIISNENQGQELFSSFTITPSSLHENPNGYVISFRDISQEITKEYDFRLSEVKNLALIQHSKSQQIAWAQSIISNNHNGAMAAELKRLYRTKTIDKIEQYVLSYMIDSGINTSNQMLTESLSSYENKSAFFINPLMQNIQSSIQKIIGSDRFRVENRIHQSIMGNPYNFLEVIYEIITSVIKYFKSGTLEKITFFHLNSPGLLYPFVSLKIQVDLSYLVTPEFIESNKTNIEYILSSQPIDSISFEFNDRTIEMQFDLKFSLADDSMIQQSGSAQNMRCLFYLEENSTLLKEMDQAFLLNHLDYIATDNADEVVKKIKEARLNKNEFNVLISDKCDFESLSQNILQEIVTYINDKFLGLIYVSEDSSILKQDKDISLYPVKQSNCLEEIRETLYSLMADFMIKSIQMPILDSPLIPGSQRVLFVNFEYYSQLLYTQLLVESGINFCLVVPEHLNEGMQTHSFDAILININHDHNSLLPVLKRIKEYWPATPACLLLPPGDEKSIAWILDNGIYHYLFKPFSLADLSSLLQQLLSK